MPAFYVDTTTAPKNKWISPEKHELDEMIEMPPRGVLQEAQWLAIYGRELANTLILLALQQIRPGNFSLGEP